MHERIVSFSRSIRDHEIELMPGVAEVLPELASRHHLILMTKGNAEEQTDKLVRSGLAHHFSSVEIPREKNPDAYHSVCQKYELKPHATWMIGNSPKSDINPALSAGLHNRLLPAKGTIFLSAREWRARERQEPSLYNSQACY